MERLRFDVYGQFFIDMVRESGWWKAYRLGVDGKRLDTGIVISGDIPKDALADWLDVYFHELSRPGTRVVQVVAGP